MMNIIWLALLVIGVLTAIATDNIDAVTNAAVEYANIAVQISIGLVGVMALWLGIMKIAEESGLVMLLSKLLKPFMVKLFPEIPSEHPAMGAIIMNMAANILGLGNAATPMGIKAMKELQELNPKKDTASNSMCMFLAINTSSITLIPTTVIALRAAAGSTNPTEIIGGAIIATVVSTIVAIIVVKLLQNLPRYRIK